MIENGWEDGRTKENGGNCWDMVKKCKKIFQSWTRFWNKSKSSETISVTKIRMFRWEDGFLKIFVVTWFPTTFPPFAKILRKQVLRNLLDKNVPKTLCRHRLWPHWTAAGVPVLRYLDNLHFSKHIHCLYIFSYQDYRWHSGWQN